MPHWIDAHGDAKKIRFPEDRGDVNVTKWPKIVLRRSTVDTMRTVSVAHHFESDTDRYRGCKNSIGTRLRRLDTLLIRFASSREMPSEHAARVHALNLR